jgi:hypothetical protein
MVDLLLLQQVSYIAGASSVVLGVIYYVFNMREQRKSRRITQTNNLMQTLLTVESNKIGGELLYMKWENYDDFEKKYGSDINMDNYAKRVSLFYTYDTLGNLLKSGLADVETLYNVGTIITAVWLWVKFKPIIEESRRRYSGKDGYAGFEYLATKMMEIKSHRDPLYKIPKTGMAYVPGERS